MKYVESYILCIERKKITKNVYSNIMNSIKFKTEWILYL